MTDENTLGRLNSLVAEMDIWARGDQLGQKMDILSTDKSIDNLWVVLNKRLPDGKSELVPLWTPGSSVLTGGDGQFTEFTNMFAVGVDQGTLKVRISQRISGHGILSGVGLVVTKGFAIADEDKVDGNMYRLFDRNMPLPGKTNKPRRILFFRSTGVFEVHFRNASLSYARVLRLE